MNKLLKPLFIGIAVFGLFINTFAHPVDLVTAKAIASKFMETNDLQLASTYTTDNSEIAFYIFNTPNGFVIVSADDCETPIIAYSHEGRFNPNDVPVQMEGHLQDFVARIQYGIVNHIEANEFTTKQWKLVKTTGHLNDRKDAKAIEPLLSEKWHQGCLYNSLCPTMEHTPCGHAEVGCVAVAMGQIMHYWGYPNTGWGSNSYYNQGIELSADFGSTNYDWEHMPDSLTESSSDAEIEAVATLLYHCGISVNMKYGENGSFANSADVPNALKRYFDFSRQLHRDKMGNSNSAWLTKLKDCLDLQRPIYYSGQGDAGGHAFVCDGYDDNDLLHFNWGWGGNGDGYFALGNMNVIGYNFNDNNHAILDIFPKYLPAVVSATVYPPTAGSIEGAGENYLGEECTLTAVPTESSKFSYWKKDGIIISQEPSITFDVTNDSNGYEAYFTYKPIDEIIAFHTPDTNDVNSPFVSLSWNFDSIHEWNLLNQIGIGFGKWATTDGEHFYTAYYSFQDDPYKYGKYTLNGELVEFFSLDGTKPTGLTCDGNYFYCGKSNGYLYQYDHENKTLIDSTYMSYAFNQCIYDANYDGFWLSHYNDNSISLNNRQGEIICLANNLTNLISQGFGGFTAEDGSQHLLILNNDTKVYDFDIPNENLSIHPIACLDYPGHAMSASIGKYDGKDALFVVLNDNGIGSNTIHIYEINCHLAPILHYRLYRSDSNGNTVMLADETTGASYLDLTWNNISAGEYRFGISEVYFNGVESEIIWSDPIMKTDHGINENDGDPALEPSIQKVIEDGKVIIIKDGKRYNVSGQRLK